MQSVCSILEWLADWPVRGRRQKSSIMISIWKTTSHLRCSSCTGWCYARCLKSHEWHPDQMATLDRFLVWRWTCVSFSINVLMRNHKLSTSRDGENMLIRAQRNHCISPGSCVVASCFTTTKWTENDAPSRQLTFHIVVRRLGSVIFDTNRRYGRRFHRYYKERMIVAIFYVLVNAVWLWTQGRVSSASISSIWQLW